MPCVLIADDNRHFTEVLRASLEDAGFEVLTAYSGLAAVTCLEQNDVSIAVLDVLMPGISGDAVAERLRQIDPTLPVVLMTGSDGGFAAGSGFPVLRKPFPHEELVETLNRLLENVAS
jgi:CheY-like chemotaxis protein